MRIALPLLALFLSLSSTLSAKERPRVFVFTDINIDSGDPDDRQSLIHLLWYCDILEIEGIVPERLDAGGFEACQLVIDAYQKDFQALSLESKGFTSPKSLRSCLADSKESAITNFHRAATREDSPLYVLIWGNMRGFRDALLQRPEIAPNLRVLTIGTGLMLERDIKHVPANWEKNAPCKQMNWNAAGRNELFDDPRFKDMWWLEMNWTYNGMFTGDEPRQLLPKLAKYGALGKHMKDVVKKESWAQYFRAGDTPTVLYLIDPQNDFDDPTHGSWAGRYQKPFPQERPHYFTDISESIEWDYAAPCATWQNHEQVLQASKATLEERRPLMYKATLQKLDSLYHSPEE
ncbi:nucleoside hydrolase-like domain-containing protein [Pelagicoccus mobilis]|uniref:DUF1593 domain-containing protein n=1 Tax=Pelagicoccus mobilis TaxID=415221 RepID=A0A934RXJ1_9BACT|nr:nucleoside hydrolase-like domain-containing protein [Pelagicoccus mobilis]MBK1876192.1 DUF1593 domain-containing protein [Pelagicoccus mobilis]